MTGGRVQIPTPLAALVQANESLPDGTRLLRLAAPFVAPGQPGQFVHLAMYADGQLLRRPFSLAGADSRTVDVVYRVHGPFTTELATVPEGRSIEATGPLGNGFGLDRSRAPILVAGGYGSPPIGYLASVAACLWKPADVRVILGARTAALLTGLERLQTLGVDLAVVTEDGSAGHTGNAAHALRDALGVIRKPAVYACGPMGMLAAVARTSLAAGAPCQVSVETPMPCGVGTCGECSLAAVDAAGSATTVLACVDGPVLDARRVAWA